MLKQVAQQGCDAPSLETLKARPDGAMSNLGYREASLAMGDWNWMILQVPSKPNHSMIL